MLHKKIFLIFFIAIISTSIKAFNHINTTTTTIIQQHSYSEENKTSLTQKIKDFCIENKPIFGAIFVLIMLGMYPHRAPIFLEWMFVHCAAQMFGAKTQTHLLFNFN